MKLTKKKAIELSINKWEWIVENDGREEGVGNSIAEIRGLKAECALCEKYLETSGNTLTECNKCPIRPHVNDYDDSEYEGCSQKCHPWTNWNYNETKENAQKVLDLIKSIKI